MIPTNIRLFLLMSVCVLASASSLNSLDDSLNANDNGLEQKLCSAMLKKPIAEFLVSEYNRASSTNHWLYIISRDPRVKCKDGDYSNCAIYIDLTPSTCSRYSTSFNCQPKSDIYKSCIAAIDLVQAMPRESLRCSPDDVEDSPAGLSQLNAMKILKKQWGFKGGNAYPI